MPKSLLGCSWYRCDVSQDGREGKRSIQRTMILTSFRKRDQSAVRISQNRSGLVARDAGLR